MSRAGEPSKDSPGLEVGRVSKAHGIAGELRIVPHWESSDALEQVQEIWLTREGKRTAYALERARATQGVPGQAARRGRPQRRGGLAGRDRQRRARRAGTARAR